MSTVDLSYATRSRVRGTSWALLASSVVTLAAIFGIGAATGAGGYFDEDPVVVEAAIADYNVEIWILLVGAGLGVLILGVALYVLGGVLAELMTGPRATVPALVRWLPLVAAAVLAAVYFRGPTVQDSLDALFTVGFTIMCVAFVAYGILMIIARLPKWMGVVAILLGGIMPWLGFLPLWWFVAGVALAVGLLRWERRARDVNVTADLATA